MSNFKAKQESRIRETGILFQIASFRTTFYFHLSTGGCSLDQVECEEEMTDTLYGEYQEQMEMTAALLGENLELNEMTGMTATLVWEKLGQGVNVFSFERRQRRRCELLQARVDDFYPPLPP